jgi:hypothetical protein
MRAVFAVMVLLLSQALAVQAEEASLLKPSLIYGASLGVDEGMTRWAEARGGFEGVPWMRGGRTSRTVFHVLGAVSLTALDVHWQRQGRKTAPRVLRIAKVGVTVIAAGIAYHDGKRGEHLGGRR